MLSRTGVKMSEQTTGMTGGNDPRNWFGDVDIYLFDQIMKGRFDACRNILEVGCGSGRNLIYFMRTGCDLYGIDQNPRAIEMVREGAARLAPSLPADNFQVADADSIPHDDGRFDAVISIALLHFADHHAHFDRMLDAMWRVLAKDGLFFVRLASTIGIEDRVEPLGDRRFRVPDGSERFLVDEEMLLQTTERIGGTLLEPIKTTNVQNMRCMSTWCLRKNR